MKTNILIPFSLLISVLVSGCTEELNDKTGQARQIRFGTSSENLKKSPSRASIVENTSDLAQDGNSFAVWGHHAPLAGGAGTSVFDATAVTYRNGQGWGYLGEEQYWQTGKEYSFHALYPLPRLLPAASSVTYEASASGNLTLKDFDATSGIDLLYAPRTGIRIANEDNIPATVSLSFRHLLSRITFVAAPEPALTEAGVTITLSSARIYGMSRSGNWNSSSTWTMNSDRTTSASPYASFEDDIELRNAEGTDLFAGDNVILMIPQAIGMELYLELKYFYSGNPTTYTTTVRLANISTALTNGWEAGKSYRYRFTMGSSQYIIFDGVETVAWQDAEGGSYNVDY